MWGCLVDFATSDGYFQSSDALAFVKRYSRKLGLGAQDCPHQGSETFVGQLRQGSDRQSELAADLMPKPILEYVVVHELCHLVHRHHSTAFWSLLKCLLPEYERRKTWLERYGAGYEL